MSKKKYLLFVDEVKPSDQFSIYNFTGVAMKETIHNAFSIDLNKIKDNALVRLGGKNVNLHFSNLIHRRQDTIFETLTKYEEQALWIDLYTLFYNTEYYILAGAVHNNRYGICYTDYRVNLEILSFKILLQNFVRFLCINNGYGEIIVESSSDDEKIREEYYRTKFSGGKYITAEGYNNVLRGIRFENKDKLLAGLQLVDCIANPVSRMVCGLNQFNLGKIDISMNYINILNTKMFDGGINDPFEFGIRKLFF